MTDFTFTMDNLPNNMNNFEAGTYTLQIIEAQKIISKTKGSTMIQCTYKILDTDKQIRFDNYPLFDKDMNPIKYGGYKLKKVINATGINVKSFTIQTIIGLLKDKKFKAYVELNEKGYPVLNDIESITACDNTEPAKEQVVYTNKTEDNVVGEIEEDDLF